MKRSHIIGLIFIIVAVGAIISTVYNAETYASFADARENPGREFHIIGTLSDNHPIEERVTDNTLLLTFGMHDRDGVFGEVTYFGAKPQDFEKSEQVVLIGQFVDNQFIASSLLLKCPSKYNPDDLRPESFGDSVYGGDAGRY